MKKTVVIGASPDPTRMSNMVAKRLVSEGYEMVPVGIKRGTIAEKDILDIRNRPEIDQVDTVTLYLNPKNQKEHYDYILSLRPKRIIFNPGTENEELVQLADNQSINSEYSCSMTMLSTGLY